MASIEKVTDSGVANWLRHNERTIEKDSNTDIDYSRTKDNYNLTPYIPAELKERYFDSKVREQIRKLEYSHYKELKEQFYCYGRKDVNTMVSVVVTLPKEIKDSETADKFFRGVADFLCDRYGNTVSITVHQDEGKHYALKDIDGKHLLDDTGNPIREWHEGRSHLHYTFIPTVEIDKAKLAQKKNPVKAMFDYKEKISAKERIDRQELLHLHPDMNRYLNDVCGIKCNVNSGITAAQGGNKSVRELKADFDKKIIKDLTVENDRLRSELDIVKRDVTQIKEKNAIVERLQGREQTKDATIDQLQGELSGTRERVRSLENELFNVRQYKTTMEHQKGEINALRGEIKELRNQLKDVEQSRNAEIETLRARNAELEARISEKDVSKIVDYGMPSGWGQGATQTAGWGNQTVSTGWEPQERSASTWDVDQ